MSDELKAILDKLKDIKIGGGLVFVDGSSRSVMSWLSDFLMSPDVKKFAVQLLSKYGLDLRDPRLSDVFSQLNSGVELVFIPSLFSSFIKKIRSLSFKTDEPTPIFDLVSPDELSAAIEAMSDTAVHSFISTFDDYLPDDVKQSVSQGTKTAAKEGTEKQKEQETFEPFAEWISKIMPKSGEQLFWNVEAYKQALAQLEKQLWLLRRMGYSISPPQIARWLFLKHFDPRQIISSILQQNGLDEVSAKIVASNYDQMFFKAIDDYLVAKVNAGEMPNMADIMNIMFSGINTLIKAGKLPGVPLSRDLIIQQYERALGKSLDELIPKDERRPGRKRGLRDALIMTWVVENLMPGFTKRPRPSEIGDQQTWRLMDQAWKENMWQTFGPIFIWGSGGSVTRAKELFRKVLEEVKPGQDFLDVWIKLGVGPRNYLHVMQTVRGIRPALEWAPSLRRDQLLQLTAGKAEKATESAKESETEAVETEAKTEPSEADRSLMEMFFGPSATTEEEQETGTRGSGGGREIEIRMR